MEILEAAMEKIGLNCKKLATFFAVLFIALPMVFIAVTSIYRTSNFGVFEGFSKVLGGRAQNVTGELLGGPPNATTIGLGLEGRAQNRTQQNIGGREKNDAVSEVLPDKIENGTATQRRGMNITKADIGLKNGSLATSSTNNSTPDNGNTGDDDIDNLHKLIDGLLVSGFDESSCMSRFQSHLYRKPSPHKPSPYLISKLRSYEAIHRNCGPNSRHYNKAMKKITNSNKNHHGSSSDHAADSSMCKYVVWAPANGLGNRMISIVATFLYAVLTKRVLLVRFQSDMLGLFCEPFLNSTWILPNHSPFWNEQHVVTYQSILDKDINAHNNSTKDLLLPSALFLNLQHTRGDSEKFFHCDHNQELLNKVPLLIILSDQYFVPSLFMTPSFSTELNRMFPENDAVFHHAARYLFHPSNEAWGRISRFYKAYLAKADEKIGLQIRVFSPNSTPHQAVMNLIMNCTLENKILPNLDMQNSVSNVKNQTLTKAVIVTSLYPYYGDNLRAMYLNKPTVNGDVIGVYQPSHEEEQKFYDNVHNIKAWMEMYLLSLSDVLVTSSLSTFGYVAQGLGALKPWQLYKLTSNGTYFPACERDLSPEPCFHIPPKHECGGMVKKHFAASFPNMFECKDYGKGVKMVNGSAQLQ